MRVSVKDSKSAEKTTNQVKNTALLENEITKETKTLGNILMYFKKNTQVDKSLNIIFCTEKVFFFILSGGLFT